MKTYKTTIRIPTDTYAYFEVEMEGTPQEIIDAHEELKNLYKASQGGEGLPDKEFNTAFDGYLSGKGMDADSYAAMSKEQMNIVQTVKRAFARIKSRNEK